MKVVQSKNDTKAEVIELEKLLGTALFKFSRMGDWSQQPTHIS